MGQGLNQNEGCAKKKNGNMETYNLIMIMQERILIGVDKRTQVS